HGTILHYDGTSWTPQTSGTTQELNGVWGSGATDVFAVGDRGTILLYDGTNWTTQRTGTAADFFKGVWGSGPTDVFAFGYDRANAANLLLHDNGVSWSAQASGTGCGLSGLWGRGAADVWAVGCGTVRDYGGASWSARASGSAGRRA